MSFRSPPAGPTPYASAAEVARRAGVSRSAVSRAFTPGASIAAGTRARVLQAAQELGYHANDLARDLLNHRSRLVGIVVTRPEVGIRAHLVAALTHALLKRGNIPVVINTGHTEADILAAHRALLGYRAEATVVLSGSPPASLVETARRHGQTLVVVGRSEQASAHLRIDNAAAALEAARRFVAAGRLRLGLLGSASATPNIVERENAFIAAAHELGARVTIARGADSDYQGGRLAGGELLAREPGLQAAFCVNDLLAFGLIDQIRLTTRLSIPRDVAVIGFDDIPEAAWGAYRLSTFRQDPLLIARAIVDLLDAPASAQPPSVSIAPSLILRDTL